MTDTTPLNSLSWFEIPTHDLSRATRFYETILGCQTKPHVMEETHMAVFPYERPGVGGCLIFGTGACPSDEGTAVYLNASPSLDAVLDRVELAGGEVVLPKTALPPGMGSFAHIRDTEGNRVGLHSL